MDVVFNIRLAWIWPEGSIGFICSYVIEHEDEIMLQPVSAEILSAWQMCIVAVKNIDAFYWRQWYKHIIDEISIVCSIAKLHVRELLAVSSLAKTKLRMHFPIFVVEYGHVTVPNSWQEKTKGGEITYAHSKWKRIWQDNEGVRIRCSTLYMATLGGLISVTSLEIYCVFT